MMNEWRWLSEFGGTQFLRKLGRKEALAGRAKYHGQVLGGQELLVALDATQEKDAVAAVHGILNPRFRVHLDATSMDIHDGGR